MQGVGAIIARLFREGGIGVLDNEEVYSKPKTSVMSVSRRWAAFLNRVMALKPGRYSIVLTVRPGGADWSIAEVGRVESVD